MEQKAGEWQACCHPVRMPRPGELCLVDIRTGRCSWGPGRPAACKAGFA